MRTAFIFTLLLLSANGWATDFSVISLPLDKSLSANANHERVELKLNAASFDPLQEQLVHGLIQEKSTAHSPYGLVQFHRDDSQVVQRLTAMGVDVLGYMPSQAYLVRWSPKQKQAVQQDKSFRFAGNYRNAYKLSPGLWQSAKSSQDKATQSPMKLELMGFPGVSSERLLQTIAKLAPDFAVLAARDLKQQSYLQLSVDHDRQNNLLKLVAMADVMWVAKHQPDQYHNIDSVGPIQANNPDITAATIWDQDLIGTGQIVAVVDSGLDRNQDFFSQYNTGSGSVGKLYTDASTPPVGQVGEINEDHKIIAYYIQPGASAYDDDSSCGEDGTPTGFHGTHVAGTVAGDSGTAATATSPNYDNGDGMAPHAQILFQDIGNTETGCLTAGDTRYEMHLQAAAAGASISSNSYGFTVEDPADEAYYFSDYQFDLASYELEDLLIVVSAGNEANQGLSHPGHAKNVVTVGALGHGSSLQTASFSSRGYAHDDRIKPDVMAPGVGIISADGDLDNSVPPSGTNNGLSAKSGTSMATPTVSGGLALMRQYFTDGFYPSGNRNSAHAIEPSGSLLKSTLLNGTLLTRSPSIDQGWGRIFLDNNLYFDGDDRTLRIWDMPNADGLKSGDELKFDVQVAAGEPFRATLTWFDPPPLTSSGQALINDLNLEVRFNGQVFKGNNWSNSESKEGGAADALNNVEQIHLSEPEAGTYEVVVKAGLVNGHSNDLDTQKQGFALVTSQAQCNSQVSGAPQISLSESNRLEPVINIQSISGVTDYQIYKKPGGCAAPNARYRFIGQTSGSGLLTFADGNSVNGETYGYAVKGVDACGEGEFSACVEIESNALCAIEPQFNTAAVNVNNTGSAGCSVTLDWAAGSSQCQANANMKYNVYRNAVADFQIGDHNRVASGVLGLNYMDSTVANNETYFYKVTAVDPIGNESRQLNGIGVFTTGSVFEPGDYVDDPDSTTQATLGTPWQITSFRSSTGEQSFHNAEDGARYKADTCAYLTLPEIELQSGSSTLTYDAAYNMEEFWDGIVVQISTDGGDSWQDLPPDGGYPSSFRDTEPQGTPVNACGFPATQGAFSGDQNQFTSFSSDLSAYAGDKVKIRWAFSSDPAVEQFGFYVDNIQIDNASAPGVCELKGLNKNAAGPWFNAEQSGHGLFVEVSDGGGSGEDRVTTFWYAYVDGQPRWLFGTGLSEGDAATIEMFTTSGGIAPPNFDPSDVNIEPWGSLTFDFTTQNNGQISWQSDVAGFSSGSMPMTKLAAISDSPRSCLSGSYSDPAQSGHGYVVEIIGEEGSEVVLMTWYSYDNAGNQIWLIGTGELNGDTATVPVSLFSGPDFPPQFDSADVDSVPWGTLQLDFSVLNTLSVSWQADLPGYQNGQVTAAKLTQLKGRGCY
ncbi:S8 family serine peptidase [Marinicella meishanensis]|uniref:S8 family serine peptidase n=1 Tax=Marinicella meishanensis TaxID=2873263 RepID=UPI001CBBF36C|nr:S8 family serine peptidase [Marinicella sp. NBU2979]